MPRALRAANSIRRPLVRPELWPASTTTGLPDTGLCGRPSGGDLSAPVDDPTRHTQGYHAATGSTIWALSASRAEACDSTQRGVASQGMGPMELLSRERSLTYSSR